MRPISRSSPAGFPSRGGVTRTVTGFAFALDADLERLPPRFWIAA